MNTQQQCEFVRAVAELLDGTLADSDASLLARQLSKDAEASELYLDFMALDVDLEWSCGRHSSQNIMASEPVGSRPSLPATTSQKSWLFSQSALCSVTLVALCFYGSFLLMAWNLRPDTPSSGADGSDVTVALVSDAANALWSADAKPKVDRAPIRQGEPLKIDSGLVELKLKSGVTFVVEGPAQWTIEGVNRASLKRGKIVARVPPQAVGFTLDTPSTRIVDLGTEFGVSVDERGATDTQVFRGVVEIETLAQEKHLTAQNKQKRKLVAGEAARVDATAESPRIETAVVKPEQFIRQLSSAPKKQDHEPSAYAKSVIKQMQPVLYWNFDNPLRDITKDLVRSQSADSFSPLSINQPGPRPTDGFAMMSAGNRAASVAGSGDVSCHQLNKTLNVATNAYSAQIWFNSSVPFDSRYIHYLLSRGNKSTIDGLRDSLFVAGNYAPQAFKTGCLAFVSNVTPADTKALVGKSLLSPDRWYLATFVRDGDRVRVYLNGALEIDAESPWYGGEGEYFTFGNRIDLQTDRGLNGLFDEVAIWDRALREGEVAALYRLAIDKAFVPQQ